MNTLKVDKALVNKLITPNLKKIFKLFDQYELEYRIIGGAVRDLILKQTPRDIDICVNVNPLQLIYILQEEFSSDILLIKGLRHGTIAVFFSETEAYEITALDFRITKANNKIIISQHPDWETDASDRDFTVNTLSMDLKGTVYDYMNAIEDIKNQEVKFVKDYHKVLQEDPLLILRFFKLIAKFKDPKYDEKIIDTIRMNLIGLSKIKRETIQWFILNIRQQKYGVNALNIMQNIGINTKDYLEYIQHIYLKKIYNG